MLIGLVEIPTTTEGDSAITGLNYKELRGRTLNDNKDRPRPEGRQVVDGVPDKRHKD